MGALPMAVRWIEGVLLGTVGTGIAVVAARHRNRDDMRHICSDELS